MIHCNVFLTIYKFPKADLLTSVLATISIETCEMNILIKFLFRSPYFVLKVELKSYVDIWAHVWFIDIKQD